MQVKDYFVSATKDIATVTIEVDMTDGGLNDIKEAIDGFTERLKWATDWNVKASKNYAAGVAAAQAKKDKEQAIADAYALIAEVEGK